MERGDASCNFEDWCLGIALKVRIQFSYHRATSSMSPAFEAGEAHRRSLRDLLPIVEIEEALKFTSVLPTYACICCVY